MPPREAMKNKDYDLGSVLYHALQGLETTEQYMHDAEREGDREVVQYLRDVQENYQDLADCAKNLLANRIRK